MRIRRCPACFAAHHLATSDDVGLPAYCAVCRAPLDANAVTDLSIPGERVHRAVHSGLGTNPVGPAFRHPPAGALTPPTITTTRTHTAGDAAAKGDASPGRATFQRARPLAVQIRTTCDIPAGALPPRPLPTLDPTANEPWASATIIPLSIDPVRANAGDPWNTAGRAGEPPQRGGRRALTLAVGAMLAVAAVVQTLLHDPRRLTLFAEISPALANSVVQVCRALPCAHYPVRPDWSAARLDHWRWTTTHRDQPTLVVTGRSPLVGPGAASGRDAGTGWDGLRRTPPIEVVDVNDRRLLVIPALPVDATALGQRQTIAPPRPAPPADQASDRSGQGGAAPDVTAASAVDADATAAPGVWGWEVRVTFHPARAHVDEHTAPQAQRFDAEALQARVGGIRLLER